MKLNCVHFMDFNIEPLEGKDVNSVMLDGCNMLDMVGMKYWLSAGTLLGLHRDGRHIPHNTDIDVGVMGGSGKEMLLIPFMEGAGFKFVRSVDYIGDQMQMAFMHVKTNIIFDIFFFYKFRSKLYNVSEHGTMKKPYHLFRELGSINVEGHDYPTPGNIEEYLAIRYGKDWRTPKSSKDDWSLECANLS